MQDTSERYGESTPGRRARQAPREADPTRDAGRPQQRDMGGVSLAAQTNEAWVADYEHADNGRSRKGHRFRYLWGAWLADVETASERLVLLCLARHAWAGSSASKRGHAPGEARIKVSTIARETLLSESTVRRTLKRLEAYGLVLREEQRSELGEQRASSYHLGDAS